MSAAFPPLILIYSFQNQSKMSGAQSKSTDKTSDPKSTAQATSNETTKPPAKLEEDDEFEDFPAEGKIHVLVVVGSWLINSQIDWTEENTDLPTGNAHLWEESWDDDDTNDDFSAQLKEELKKADAKK
jgi:26 proteasome complex subunit DSS1